MPSAGTQASRVKWRLDDTSDDKLPPAAGYNQGLTVSAEKPHKAALNRSTSLPVQFGEEAGPALHGRSAAGNKQLQRPRSSGGLGLHARTSS